MDQKKIGNLLKILRKEKNLTQEQLAEIFNVSNRTVSRWETGNNLPDLSLLVELADFYQVDMREIIDGERKSETMNLAEKETFMKVADYAETKHNKILKRIQIIDIVGIFVMLLCTFLDVSDTSTPLRFFVDFLYGSALGIMVVNFMYVTGVMDKINENPKNCKRKKIAAIIFGSIAIICMLFSIFSS